MTKERDEMLLDKKVFEEMVSCLKDNYSENSEIIREIAEEAYYAAVGDNHEKLGGIDEEKVDAIENVLLDYELDDVEVVAEALADIMFPN